MIIFPEQKVIFVAIPKTGSTSIHHAYKAKSAEPEEHHSSLAKILVRHQECNNSDWGSFAFVRNPYDRLVSLFHDFKFVRKNNYSEKIILSHPALFQYDDFQHFVLNLECSPWLHDVHFCQQVEFTHICPTRPVNFIGKYENLIEDFKRAIYLFDLPDVNLGHDRKTDHKPWQEYYDEQMKDIVYSLYKQDFQEFGYEK